MPTSSATSKWRRCTRSAVFKCDLERYAAAPFEYDPHHIAALRTAIAAFEAEETGVQALQRLLRLLEAVRAYHDWLNHPAAVDDEINQAITAVMTASGVKR